MKKLFIIGIILTGLIFGFNVLAQVFIEKIGNYYRQSEQSEVLGAIPFFYPFQGGTGTSTAPAYGEILVGNANNVYDVVATSTLGITSAFGDLTDVATSSDATGDIYYRNSSGQITNLGIGAAGTLLGSSGGLPVYISTSTLLHDSDFLGNGLMVNTANGTYANRTLATSTDHIVIVTPNGTGGNPTFTIRESAFTSLSSLATVGTLTGGTLALDSLSFTGTLNHEYGGLEFDASAVTTGGLIRGASAGAMELLALGTPGQVLGVTGGQLGYISTSTMPFISTALTKGYFLVGDDAGLAQATSSLFVSSTGNIGIASTTPGAKLAVTNTGTGLTFLAADQSDPDPTPFTITADGSVGIGTAAPTAKLEVVGGSVVIPNNQFLYGWNSAGSASRELLGLTSVNNIQLGGTGTHPLTFLSGSSEKIRMDTSGNFGIGTTTPASKLEVYGGMMRAFNTASSTCDATVRGGIFYNQANDSFWGCKSTGFQRLDN